MNNIAAIEKDIEHAHRLIQLREENSEALVSCLNSIKEKINLQHNTDIGSDVSAQLDLLLHDCFKKEDIEWFKRCN